MVFRSLTHFNKALAVSLRGGYDSGYDLREEAMALTELIIRKSKAGAKTISMGDGNGLWLVIFPHGSKLWRFKYKFLGKETSLSLGSYPEISLSEAREKQSDARKLLQNQINPSTARKEEKQLAKFRQNNSFRAVAEEWHATNLRKWTTEHGKKLWRRLEIHILPTLGNRPISEISALDLLEVLRRVEKLGKTETTHRALHYCTSIFRYAVLTRRMNYNPASDLQGALKPHSGTHFPTITQRQIPEFFARLDEANTSELNRLAIKFLMLTMVRQGELRLAKWGDFDFRAKEWRIRPETTKMRTLHHVPLSIHALELLAAIKKISGEAEYVFPSQQNKKNAYMSENTINKVLHRIGYKGELVGHGFRSLASTILNENGFRPDVIERQLAHMPRDQVRAAYNRAEYLPERRKMMHWWDDFLTLSGLK
jgi:integrase